MKRTAFTMKIRRSCRVCEKRVELRDKEWVHLRTADHPADPYKTKRQPKKATLNRQKDREWAKGILFDSEGNPRPCVVCGGTVGIQAAHIIPRSQSRAVHWHPLNGLPLCAGPGSNSCHFKVDSHRINRLELIERTIGLDAYRMLNVEASRAPERGL